MTTQVLQSTLKGALSIVTKAVAGKSSLPVLSNILFRASEGRLVLSATNLEIGLVVPVSAKTTEEWAGTFPAKLVLDIVSNLPNDRVDLSYDAQRVELTIKCQGSTSKIKGIEADEFPVIPNGDNATPLFTMAADAIKSALLRTTFAAASDDSRPVLAGVNFQDGKIAATDGFRLAVADLPFQGGAIIPARALATLTSIIGEGEVSASLTNGQAIFGSDGFTLVTRLIDGKYPDFARIIPTAHTTRAVFDVAELLKAVKLAGFFAASSQDVIKLVIIPGLAGDDDRMVISANAAETGDSEGIVSGMVSGEGGKIAVNYHYLLDALGAIKVPQVAIEMQGERTPLVLKPVGDETYTHLCMPMTLR